MTARRAVMFVATALAVGLPGVSPAEDVRIEVPARRPYITEVGAPHSISMAAVEKEAQKISEMKTYLVEYGYPDYAEVQEIEPQWPWESYEVRLYYMRRNRQTDFGHVFLSEALPTFGVMKYQGVIPPEKRREIEVVLAARQEPAPPAVATMEPGEALVARVEAAAERAAQAAERAAEASEAANRAAERTANLVDKWIEQNQ